MARDNFSEATKELLAKRVAYRCSNPACARVTVGPSSVENEIVNLGVAAHIAAASEGGPRYDQSLSAAERASIQNGIWLCQSCAALIDRDVEMYPVPLLRQWKQEAECAAFGQQRRTSKPAGKLATSPDVIELILRRYCEDRVSEWEEARADPEDPDKLMHYIEPHYSLLKQGLRPVEASSMVGRGGGKPEKRDDPYQPVAETGDDAITELVKLINASKRLCITEDAGAGKSMYPRLTVVSHYTTTTDAAAPTAVELAVEFDGHLAIVGLFRLGLDEREPAARPTPAVARGELVAVPNH